MKDVGLVLEGGGMRGLYTAGVLDTLMNEDIKVGGMVTVSAGALFGINYASGQKGRALRYNKTYIKDKRYMGIRQLIKTGDIISKDFAYYTVPFDDGDSETNYITENEMQIDKDYYSMNYNPLIMLKNSNYTNE